MRILKVSDVYFPRVNGVSTSIDTFTRDLRGLGHNVTLVAPRYAEEPVGIDAEVLRVAARPVPRDPEDRLMSWRGLATLTPQLARRQFDVVHIHTPFLAHYAALRYARALGIPVVATYHTFFEEYLHHYLPAVPRGLSRPLARAFSRAQCNQVAAIVSPSIAMRDTLLAYGVRQPIEVLPTGLPVDRFRPGEGSRFRERHGIALDRPLLLYVGRLAHEKNIDFLLAAHQRLLAQQPQALLLIAGEGPAAESLQQNVRRRGLAGKVQFAGYLERHSELLDCYHAADLFVFASRTETQGLVLLEAMAQGVPVLALAAMGTIDILSPGRGAVIAADDPVAFGATAASLLAAPATLAALGDSAREYAESWSSRRMAEKLASLYERVTRPQSMKTGEIAIAGP